VPGGRRWVRLGRAARELLDLAPPLARRAVVVPPAEHDKTLTLPDAPREAPGVVLAARRLAHRVDAPREREPASAARLRCRRGEDREREARRGVRLRRRYRAFAPASQEERRVRRPRER